VSSEEFKSKVADELKKFDENAAKPPPTPLDEERLRRQNPPFHNDPDKIKEFHSYLVLRRIEICNFCDWRNPDFPIENVEKWNGVNAPDLLSRMSDPSSYGSYSGKRQQRVADYFRARELGWSHEKISGIMGRFMNAGTLDDYKNVYDNWKRSKQESKNDLQI